MTDDHTGSAAPAEHRADLIPPTIGYPEWRLVPVEPTQAMRNAAADWIGSDGKWQAHSPQHKGDLIYAAMLKASPAPEKAPGEWRSFSPTEADIFAFLCRKYVQRADERQMGLGLQYMSAETHDLATALAEFFWKFAEANPLPAPPALPGGEGEQGLSPAQSLPGSDAGAPAPRCRPAPLSGGEG